MAPPYSSQMRFGPSISPMVKSLIIINISLFVIQLVFRAIGNPVMESIFALNPDQVNNLWIWQLISYSFLHVDFLHLLFNMLALWMFGSELENHWNSDIFLRVYLFSSLLGGIATYLVNFFYDQGIVLGASGGVYGLLVAYAMIWPNREILFMMVFPLRAKFFVLILMLMIAFAQGGNVAHIAHAGGALGGFLFVRFFSFFKKILPINFSFSRYMQKRRFQKYQEEMAMKENSKEKVDELLGKISSSGMKSLTKKEKRFLNEASKNYFNEN